MKEQIEEIWDIITTDCDNNCGGCKFENDTWCFTHYVAEHLYNAGYRKQKEGEWKKHEESIWEHRYWCSVCNFYRIGAPTPHCQNCGAKMKGGEANA